MMEELSMAAEEAANELADGLKLGRVKLWFARLERWRGEHSKALFLALTAEEVGKKYNDVVLLGEAQEIHSNILFWQGRFDESEKLAQAIVEIGKKYNLPYLHYYGSERLSNIDICKDDFIGAEQRVNEAEYCAEQMNSKRAMASIGLRRAQILMVQKRYDEAEALFMQNINFFFEEGLERRRIADGKRYLAILYQNTNRMQLARRTAADALDIYRRIGMDKLAQSMEEYISRLPSN